MVLYPEKDFNNIPGTVYSILSRLSFIYIRPFKGNLSKDSVNFLFWNWYENSLILTLGFVHCDITISLSCHNGIYVQFRSTNVKVIFCHILISGFVHCDIILSLSFHNGIYVQFISTNVEVIFWCACHICMPILSTMTTTTLWGRINENSLQHKIIMTLRQISCFTTIYFSCYKNQCITIWNDYDKSPMQI